MRFIIENIFFLVVTYGGAPLWYSMTLVRRCFGRNADVPRVLIIQSARIGDMVCITPVFREIKKKYPKAFIATLVAEPAVGVTFKNSYIDKFYFYDTSNDIAAALKAFFQIKPFVYDYSFNFFPGKLGNALPLWLGIPWRITTTISVASKTLKLLFPFSNVREFYQKEESAPHHHLKLLHHLGVRPLSDQREVFRNPESDQKVLQVFQKLGINTQKTIIAISTGCGKGFRKWPLDHFRETIRWILEQYPEAQIVLTGGREDQEANQQLMKEIKNERLLDTTTMFTIVDLPSFFAYVKLFISVSTGPLYIADAAGCATIDIIGTDTAINQAPQGNTMVVENNSVPSCSYVMYPLTCSPEAMAIRMDISIEQVTRAVSALLKK